MRKAARMAWTFFFTIVVTTLFFFLPITPARAPHGGKNLLGGRTIASMQEEEFDRKLLKYQLCYGVNFNSASTTLERRRVCKAMLMHQLDLAFEKSGAYLRAPVEFQCDDTAFGKKEWENSGVAVVALKPNAEEESIERALASYIDYKKINSVEEGAVKEACDFLTSCKTSMRTLSFRQIGTCLTTKNVMHRRVLLDEIGTMIFSSRTEPRFLYTELVEQPRK